MGNNRSPKSGPIKKKAIISLTVVSLRNPPAREARRKFRGGGFSAFDGYSWDPGQRLIAREAKEFRLRIDGLES